MSPLPRVKPEALNAYNGFYLGPVGCDPADCFAYLGVETSRQRSYYGRKGFQLIQEVAGEINESDNRLRISPPSLERCSEILAELQSRVPEERDRLMELLGMHADAASDKEMRRDERMQSRTALKNIREKLVDTYAILPLSPEERKDLEREVATLEATAANPDALPEDRRDARDQGRELSDRLARIKRVKVITPEALAAFFLNHHRQMVSLVVPPWVRAGQQLMEQEQQLAAQEAELTQ